MDRLCRLCRPSVLQQTDDVMTDCAQEQYTDKELEVAKACVALVKCSRGTINVALKASDSAGKLVVQVNADDTEKRTAVLTWIGKVHDLARQVGTGMTDLGTLLYPTLSFDEIESQGGSVAEIDRCHNGSWEGQVTSVGCRSTTSTSCWARALAHEH